MREASGYLVVLIVATSGFWSENVVAHEDKPAYCGDANTPAPESKPTASGSECTANYKIELGEQELLRDNRDPIAAVADLQEGIGELERVHSAGPSPCQGVLAEAYVYVGVAFNYPPYRSDPVLQRAAARGAFEHALQLSGPRATETACVLWKIMDRNWRDIFGEAAVFESKMRSAIEKQARALPPGSAKGAGIPKWLVLALGGFAAKPLHTDQGPLAGLLGLVGVGSRRGLSAGPFVGVSLNDDGKALVLGGALRYEVAPRIGLMYGFGWRFSDGQTLHGGGVGMSYRFGKS